jgi:hypothetical protein
MAPSKSFVERLKKLGMAEIVGPLRFENHDISHNHLPADIQQLKRSLR